MYVTTQWPRSYDFGLKGTIGINWYTQGSDNTIVGRLFICGGHGGTQASQQQTRAAMPFEGAKDIGFSFGATLGVGSPQRAQCSALAACFLPGIRGHTLHRRRGGRELAKATTS